MECHFIWGLERENGVRSANPGIGDIEIPIFVSIQLGFDLYIVFFSRSITNREELQLWKEPEIPLSNLLFYLQENWSPERERVWSRSHSLVVTQLGVESRSAHSQAKALCTECIWYKKARKHAVMSQGRILLQQDCKAI